MFFKRMAWVGLLAAYVCPAGADPPHNARLGHALIRAGEAISAQDWLDPSDLVEDTAVAQVPEEASPLPEEEPASPDPNGDEPLSPMEETPAEAPLTEPAPPRPALPETIPPPVPSELPEAPVAFPGAVDPVVEAEPGGPTLLERAINLERIDLNELYRALQESFPSQTLELSLDQVIDLALRENQDILVTSYDPLLASADILAARGEFDPVLSNTSNYLRAAQTVSSEIETFGGISSTRVYQTTSQTSLQGRLPWGTGYNITLDLTDEETTFTQFIEEWSGGLTFSLSQPLLRGRGAAYNRTRIRVAEKAREIAESQLRATVMDSIARTINAYWDLVGAIRQVEARKAALANAERLLDISQKRLEIGSAAEIEVVQAKAGVATRQSDLIAARAQVETASDVLKNLIGIIDEEPLRQMRIVPTTAPDVRDLEINQVEAVALALRNRPEIESAQLQIESARLEERRAAGDLLPQFDVQGSATFGGRGHKPSDVFEGIEDSQDEAYTIGFQAAVPLGNRTARGQHLRTRLSVRQSQQRLEQARQSLILRVQQALTQVQTSRVLVESTKQTEALQQINLEAEERRLQLGVTTSFRVLEVEEDLTLARTQYIQALVDYEQAVVDLLLAEGVLLEEYGIEFEPPEAEEPVSYLRSLWPVPVDAPE